MQQRVILVAGTDTGVGKTVLASLLTRRLRERGLAVAALKPFCSGSRSDARELRGAGGAVLALEEVNPWHFRAPLAPWLAARQEGVTVSRAQVLRHIRSVCRRFPRVIVEGAGGLLSPLAQELDSRRLIQSLNAQPVVVSLNRLGAVNHVLLTLEALAGGQQPDAIVVLMNPRRAAPAVRSNPILLGEMLPRTPIHTLPWLTQQEWRSHPLAAGLSRKLDSICESAGLR